MNISEPDNFILPDGRKTSDLKVVDLKKELFKLGLPKTGTKLELLTNLNAALSTNSNHINETIKVDSINSSQVLIQKKPSRRRITFGVDLDDYDGIIQDQSIDTLEIGAPIDYSLTPLEDTGQEDQIEINALKDGEIECNIKDESLSASVSKDEDDFTEEGNVDDEDSASKVETLDNGTDGLVHDDIAELSEVCVEDNSEGVVEDSSEEMAEDNSEGVVNDHSDVAVVESSEGLVEGKHEVAVQDNREDTMEELTDSNDSKSGINISEERIRITIRTSADEDNNSYTKLGEDTVVLPISARLGKRKVSDDDDIDLSPRKIIRRSLDIDDVNARNILRRVVEDCDGGNNPRKILRKDSENKEAEINSRTKKINFHETKASSCLFDETLRVRSPKKSKYVASAIVRVDNLVRPFTMTQLQDLLSHNGTVLDLWLNKIKSCAYVKYGNEDAACSTRGNLDGCKWPSNNPKLLEVDFVSYKEMEWMKSYGDSGIPPPMKLRLLERPQGATDSEKLNVRKIDIDWRDREEKFKNEGKNVQINEFKDLAQIEKKDIHRDIQIEKHVEGRKEKQNASFKDESVGCENVASKEGFRDVGEDKYKEERNVKIMPGDQKCERRKIRRDGIGMLNKGNYDGFREVRGDEHKKSNTAGSREVRREDEREVFRDVDRDGFKEVRRGELKDAQEMQQVSTREVIREDRKRQKKEESDHVRRRVRKEDHRVEMKEGDREWRRDVRKEDQREEQREDDREWRRDVRKEDQREDQREDDREWTRAVQKDVRRQRSKEKSKHAPVKKRLEDLFHKTSTMPPIYWQPVSQDTKSISARSHKKVSVMHLF